MLSTYVIVEPLETEEYENRTSINRALKRRWSTDSLENQSQKAAAAQQKIRRYSAYDSAEGEDVLSCKLLLPLPTLPPPQKKKEIKPENMHHGQGREFHNIVSGQYEDNNNACLYLQRQ